MQRIRRSHFVIWFPMVFTRLLFLLPAVEWWIGAADFKHFLPLDFSSHFFLLFKFNRCLTYSANAINLILSNFSKKHRLNTTYIMIIIIHKLQLPQMLTLIQFECAVQIFHANWNGIALQVGCIYRIYCSHSHSRYHMHHIYIFSPNRIPSFEPDFGMALKGRLEYFTAILHDYVGFIY